MSQTIAGPSLSIASSGTGTIPPRSESEVERKKGVRFFFEEEDDNDDNEENNDDNEDNNSEDEDNSGDLEDDTYDEMDAQTSMGNDAEAEADDEVRRSITDEVMVRFNTMDVNDSPAGTVEADPIDEYYDNHGEMDEDDMTRSSNKDQERLDRFMQPTSSSDEGVIELNRERIDWQSMLQSVLTGDVFSIENKRLENPNFEIQPAIKQQIWLGIRATLWSRPVNDEQRFVDMARAHVDGFLQEVLDFKVDPNNPKSSVDQVLDVLHKVDIVESLYPKTDAIDKPVYKSPKFQFRLGALNAFASIMKQMKIQYSILKDWTGSDTLTVTRSETADPDEVSFVDHLLKENRLELTFKKKTLKSLKVALHQIKKTMIENAVAFASMGLVPTMPELQQLIRFPATLMQECLRLRLEYSGLLTVPTLQIVDQKLEEFKSSLFLACEIRFDYEELECPEDGWYITPSISSDYEEVLKKSMTFYFKLLAWKVEYWGQSKKYTDSVLDLEWESLSDLGQKIDGIGLDTAGQLWYGYQNNDYID